MPTGNDASPTCCVLQIALHLVDGDVSVKIETDADGPKCVPALELDPWDPVKKFFPWKVTRVIDWSVHSISVLLCTSGSIWKAL